MELLPYSPERDDMNILGCWRQRENLDFPINLLPETGYVAQSVRGFIGAVFLYETNSEIAWVAWPVTNPNASSEERNTALELLFAKMEEVAKEKGYKFVLTTTKNAKVSKRLVNNKWVVGDTEVTQYIKKVV